MISFTKQERVILVGLAVVLIAGSFLHFVFKKLPYLEAFFLRFETEEVYYLIDINKATEDDLVKLPYIGEYTAGEIVRYRERRGRFTSLEELKNVKGIKEKNLRKFVPYLKITKMEKKK